MKGIFNSFWKWYNKHIVLATGIAAGLFVLQLVHLTWLGLHVVAYKALGISLWNPSPFWQNIIILVDYTEIPALISVSLVYINDIRKNGVRIKPVWYIFSLAIQLLHMFWITDEFVLATIHQAELVTLPSWLAWVAILIDYLEVPVIIETFKKLKESLGKKDLQKIKEAFSE